ncbi:hypothetical protein COOONC_04082 [Cooperia oncophora]
MDFKSTGYLVDISLELSSTGSIFALIHCLSQCLTFQSYSCIHYSMLPSNRGDMKRSASPPSESSASAPIKQVKSSAKDSPSTSKPVSTMDNSSLLDALNELQNTAFFAPSYNRNYRPLACARLFDPKITPKRPLRDRTPLELISDLAKGNFAAYDVRQDSDDASEDRSLPPSERLSLQIAQSLTLAENFDHTFNVEQLSTRDFVMIDAFMRHAVYSAFREWIVEESCYPTPADLAYPPAYKALHTATEKASTFTRDLANNPDYWKSEEKLAELNEELLTLLYNIQTHRNTLTDILMSFVFNPIEEQREVVDLLNYYNIKVGCLKFVCTAATGEMATGFLTLKKINSAIARLHNITLESSLPAETVDIPTSEELQVLTRDPTKPTTQPTVEPMSPSSTPKPSQSSTSKPTSVSTTTSTTLQIRSSTSVTTTGKSTSPQQQKVIVSVSPHHSPSSSARSKSPSSSSRRSVRTVRRVATRRSPSQDRSSRGPSRIFRRSEDRRSPSRQSDTRQRRRSPAPRSPPRRQSPQGERSYRSVNPPEDHPASFAEVRIVVHLRGSPIRVRDVGHRLLALLLADNRHRESGAIDPSIVCFFCEANHYTANCTTIKSLTDRATKLVSVGRCLYCLYVHAPGYCRRDTPCRVCDSDEHHPALCPYSYFLVRDIGPDVKTFFKAMYVLYENYYIRHPKS